jgi:Tfp pilus assembly protein PilF
VRRGSAIALVGILLFGLIVRIGYVAAQLSSDPTFARPMLDGAYYLEWARAIASGAGGPEGAFYLAPIYPYLLAGFLAIFGESFAALALVQNVLALLTALLLFAIARRTVGEVAALATAALFLLYHPVLFFASRPLGDTVALFFLVLALLFASIRSSVAAGGAGASLGATALARPNLLLVGLGLVLQEFASRRWVRALALTGGIALVVLPVTVRNLAVSGHLVPISSNEGITLYHGNGPGALGVFTPSEGLSGDLSRQREEATAVARARTGRPLDPVEADRWFRDEAVRTRCEAPLRTVWLLLRRVALLLDNFEHSLDYAPSLDRNPWRFGAPVPFAVLLGLACAGVAASGFRRSGGPLVWIAIGASAVTPIVFYVSSRYRLPVAALLTIPAGAGVVSLLRPVRRLVPVVAIACAIASFVVPSGALRRSEESAALLNRGVARKQEGDPSGAERDFRAALVLDAGSAPVWYNLGTLLEGSGRPAEAEQAYRESLARDPGGVEAAGNLGALLVRRGDPDAAVVVLRRGLASRPRHVVSWTNLVVALVAGGRVEEARRAARQAQDAGVELSPELMAAIGMAPSSPEGESNR